MGGRRTETRQSANGTVSLYQSTIERIGQYPIGDRKLKTVTPDHLQAFFDLLAFGGEKPDGSEAKPLASNSIRPYSAVMQARFRFAVFPKRLMTFNPMQYVKIRHKQETYELFNENSEDGLTVPTISFEQYKALTDYLKRKRIRRSCLFRSPTTRGFGSARSALSRQDIDMREQTITVRRDALQRDEAQDGGQHHQTGQNPHGGLLRHAGGDPQRRPRPSKAQNRFKYGELYSLNYYKQVQEKGRELLRVVQSAKVGRSAGGLQGDRLRLSPPGWML